MRFKLIMGLMIAGLLAGCGGGSSPEERAAAAAKNAERNAVWPDRQTVSYKGNPYLVAVNPERTKAYVSISGPKFSHSINDLKGAVRTASGCQGGLDAGALVALGMSNDSDISIVSKVDGTSPPIWTVGLKC